MVGLEEYFRFWPMKSFKMDGLVCCLIDFQLNNVECFFIDKATERGDAVASLGEVNAVRWENRQVI